MRRLGLVLIVMAATLFAGISVGLTMTRGDGSPMDSPTMSRREYPANGAQHTAVHESEASAHELVVVRPGETLWEIANRHRPAGVDTRRMVDRIREANRLPSAAVYPGQLLKVPRGR
ncbi:MAG: LysM peptidoglycan-binding domain-containing protein [Firmicutes bacterium]|nr:LysM peptidoglycan-binding domain-containing protein [Bacillota bacterium]